MKSQSVRPRSYITLALFVAVSSAWSQTRPSVRHLISLLGTPQAATAKAQLTRIGSEALPELAQAAYAKKLSARLDAIEVLSKIGTFDQCLELADLITDPTVAVREPASKALDEVETREATRLYQECLTALTAKKLEKLEKPRRGFPFGSINTDSPEELSAFKLAVSLGKWRVEVLNWMDRPTPDGAKQLLSNLLNRDLEDYSIHTQQPATLGCGGCCTGPTPSEVALRILCTASPDTISEYLLDENNIFRTGVLDSLGANLPVELEPTLVKLAHDPADSVRLSDCNALASFEDEGSLSALLDLASDPIPSIRFRSLCSLKDVSPKVAISVAIKLTQDSLTREAVLQIFDCLGSLETLPELVSLLQSADRELASSSCSVIGKIKGNEASAILKDVISSGPKDLRAQAAESLWRYDASLAVPVLIKCLDDSDKAVVIAGCFSLGALGDVEGLPKLEELRHSKDHEIRAEAVRAIDKLIAKSNLPPP
jgi:HEAT repeat protein